ncbi:hypothetical protein HPP92_011414 [Vanilla planifolia]|uniref:CCHC-type domain-containing protein n=1 Tax=Vanilla planifolia TaxID=51239 RepID=A0A835R0J2_VANPL|nr:hypothetical protein HPP92_011414 [Vanilla planifolia]
MQRTSYARVCVRMDLTKPLKSGLWLSGDLGKSFQPIEYEGLPRICYACGHVGHVVEHCPKKKMEKETVKNTTTNTGLAAYCTGSEELCASNGSIFVESPAVVPPCAPPAQTQDMHADETVREGLGPWMVVQPRKRRPIQITNDHQNTGQRSHAIDSTVRGIKREEGRDRIAIRRRRSASIVRGREPIQRSWAPKGVTRSAPNNRHELLIGTRARKQCPWTKWRRKTATAA